jgi:hypothetical protein
MVSKDVVSPMGVKEEQCVVVCVCVCEMLMNP